MSESGIVLHTSPIRIRSLLVVFLTAEGVRECILPDSSHGAPVFGGRYDFIFQGKLLRSFSPVCEVPLALEQMLYGQALCEFLNKLGRDADISELFEPAWEVLGHSPSFQDRLPVFYRRFLQFLGTGELVAACSYCQRGVISYIVTDLGVQCDQCAVPSEGICFSPVESALLSGLSSFDSTSSAVSEALCRKIFSHFSMHIGTLRTLSWLDMAAAAP